MFEDRAIEVLAYNLETVLAKKLETVISRASTNTRMRDFYDIRILLQLYGPTLDTNPLSAALYATARKRGSVQLLSEAEEVLVELLNSTYMKYLWERYRNKFQYASDLPWDAAMDAVRSLCIKAGLAVEPPKDISLIKQAPKEKSHGVPER